MRATLGWLAAGVAMWAGPAPLCAQLISVNSQTRSVSALLTTDNVAETLVAPDLGPFDAVVDREATVPGGDVIRAEAGISCTFDFDRVRVRGRLEARGGGEGIAGFSGVATTVVDVMFTVLMGDQFRLDGDSIDASDSEDPYELRLIDFASGETLFLSNNSQNALDGCHVFGDISPGVYRLVYSTVLSSDGADRGGDYDVTLRILPTPAGIVVLGASGLVLGRRRRA